MENRKYPFPLAVQTVLPPDYRENTIFQSDMRLLQELGFNGVELNIAHPENENITSIRRFLFKEDIQASADYLAQLPLT